MAIRFDSIRFHTPDRNRRNPPPFLNRITLGSPARGGPGLITPCSTRIVWLRKPQCSPFVFKERRVPANTAQAALQPLRAKTSGLRFVISRLKYEPCDMHAAIYRSLITTWNGTIHMFALLSASAFDFFANRDIGPPHDGDGWAAAHTI